MSSINIKKNPFDFTLGADPEFACINKKGEVIRAGEVISNAQNQQFGADGNGITFEVRPDPSPDPIKVVTNLRDIFQNQVTEKPSFLKWEWLAGSFQKSYPLGGHIHFGIKEDKIHPVTACEILSQYLGAIALLIEDPQQAKDRRGRGGYGGFSDHRVQTHGFEYRTLSSWLVSPYIAGAFR